MTRPLHNMGEQFFTKGDYASSDGDRAPSAAILAEALTTAKSIGFKAVIVYSAHRHCEALHDTEGIAAVLDATRASLRAKPS